MNSPAPDGEQINIGEDTNDPYFKLRIVIVLSKLWERELGTMSVANLGLRAPAHPGALDSEFSDH